MLILIPCTDCSRSRGLILILILILILVLPPKGHKASPRLTTAGCKGQNVFLNIIHAMSHHHTCYVTSSYMLCNIIIHGCKRKENVFCTMWCM
jgi:hypothetical protein